VTGKTIKTYHLEGETEYNYRKNVYIPDPSLNAIVSSAPCLFSAQNELKAEMVRQ
jgi:hypothetical protein